MENGEFGWLVDGMHNVLLYFVHDLTSKEKVKEKEIGIVAMVGRRKVVVFTVFILVTEQSVTSVE